MKKIKELVNTGKVIIDGFVNKEGNFQHEPHFVTTDYIEIDKYYFEEVLKNEINPVGFNFGLYDENKEIIKEKVIIEGKEVVIFSTSTDAFPKWKDNTRFVRFSKLHPSGYFNPNWLNKTER